MDFRQCGSRSWRTAPLESEASGACPRSGRAPVDENTVFDWRPASWRGCRCPSTAQAAGSTVLALSQLARLRHAQAGSILEEEAADDRPYRRRVCPLSSWRTAAAPACVHQPRVATPSQLAAKGAIAVLTVVSNLKAGGCGEAADQGPATCSGGTNPPPGVYLLAVRDGAADVAEDHDARAGFGTFGASAKLGSAPRFDIEAPGSDSVRLLQWCPSRQTSRVTGSSHSCSALIVRSRRRSSG